MKQQQEPSTDFAQLVGMIGTTSDELAHYLRVRGFKISGRTVRKWMQTGVVPESRLTCLDAVFYLHSEVFDLFGEGNPLGPGLPQHVYDRRRVIDTYRPEEYSWNLERRLKELKKKERIIIRRSKRKSDRADLETEAQ
jgi:hypothetical protein